MEQMKVRMTYCNMDTEEIRYFEYIYSIRELGEWFGGLLDEYRKWSDAEIAWKKKRQESIHTIQFPFPYREAKRACDPCISHDMP